MIMFNLLRSFKNKPIKYLVSLLVVFALLCFVEISYCMKITNDEIGDFLFSKLGVKMIVYGDINDVGGYVYSIDELNEIKSIYDEMLEELNKIGGNKVKYETYLMTNKIYSAYDLYNENDYQIIYFDHFDSRLDSDLQLFGSLDSISRDFETNRQYITFFENHPIYNPDASNDENDYKKKDSYNGNYQGAIPMLVGVNSPIWSDISLGYMSIGEGRTFTTQEIENGENVCIVNNDTYIIERNGIRLVEVGDIIPITIHVKDNIEVKEFKVIGINDAYGNSGLQVQSGISYEQFGTLFMQSNTYINYVYIPDKCLKDINDIFLDYCNQENYQPIKEDIAGRISFDNDEIFYSLYGGIRPVVIEIDSQDKLDEISNLLSTSVKKMNEVADRPVEYTYFSNLDSFATVISNVNIGKTLFTYLSVIAILVCVLFFVAYVNNDINRSRKEIGISIALGMNKRSVMLQKFLEYLSIIIIPFILSTALVYFINNQYIEYINNSVISVGLGSMIFDGYVDAITINIPPYIIVVLILIVLICLFISCLVGYFKIKKLNVKAILLEGDGV